MYFLIMDDANANADYYDVDDVVDANDDAAGATSSASAIAKSLLLGITSNITRSEMATLDTFTYKHFIEFF